MNPMHDVLVFLNDIAVANYYSGNIDDAIDALAYSYIYVSKDDGQVLTNFARFLIMRYNIGSATYYLSRAVWLGHIPAIMILLTIICSCSIGQCCCWISVFTKLGWHQAKLRVDAKAGCDAKAKPRQSKMRCQTPSTRDSRCYSPCKTPSSTATPQPASPQPSSFVSHCWGDDSLSEDRRLAKKFMTEVETLIEEGEEIFDEDDDEDVEYFDEGDESEDDYDDGDEDDDDDADEDDDDEPLLRRRVKPELRSKAKCEAKASNRMLKKAQAKERKALAESDTGCMQQ